MCGFINPKHCHLVVLDFIGLHRGSTAVPPVHPKAQPWKNRTKCSRPSCKLWINKVRGVGIINRRNGAALVSKVPQRPTLSTVMLSAVCLIKTVGAVMSPPAPWCAEMQGKKDFGVNNLAACVLCCKTIQWAPRQAWPLAPTRSSKPLPGCLYGTNHSVPKFRNCEIRVLAT